MKARKPESQQAGEPAGQGASRARRLAGLLACWLSGLLVVTAAVSLLLHNSSRHAPPVPSPVPSSATAPVEVPIAQLELRSGRLHRVGAANPFSGLMVEHYPDGALRSRSAVTNGLLHGLSQGWHTNGQFQVAEHFKEGVSHGLRTKWYASGAKLSEATIVEGKLHGRFRRWHENGALAEEVPFTDGQSDGVALAYFESGFLKSRSEMGSGQVVTQRFWKDGEQRASPDTVIQAAAALPGGVKPPAFLATALERGLESASRRPGSQ
jgi:hypothetical protein